MLVAMARQHPIKVFRKAQVPRMSQEDLARKVGVDRVTIARWEAGRKPGHDILPKLVRVTGIPASKLRPDMAAMFAGAAE